MARKFTRFDEKVLLYQDDHLFIPEVRSWTVLKYSLLYLNVAMFSTSMKNSPFFKSRTYLDLCSGCGCGRLKDTTQIYKGSPLIALSVPDKFDKYIFCEKDTQPYLALEQRIKNYKISNIKLYNEDCNNCVDSIINDIPIDSISFCFIDPRAIDVKFDTIMKLANSGRMDFLILLALGMDAKRNVVLYTEEDNSRIDDLLGSVEWRNKWGKNKMMGDKFSRFIAEEFSDRMASLEYIRVPISKMQAFKSDVKNLSLYHLAFFSKHELGYKFWTESLKYNFDQGSLF